MQNRETAKNFNTFPTGNMRATSYRFMPLIRMACTCIGNGDRSVNEIIKEVKNGYLISNMKIPSIDMNRYNWSISCQYAQKIENGEITDLLRDVIVMGTAPEFFESIDACGNDFTVRPITNCGKGDPMQSMIMGNGGPTIRGTATVKSVNQMNEIEEIKQQVMKCTKCKLSKTRTNSVPGKGNFRSEIIFVGEAPEEMKIKMENHLQELQEKSYHGHLKKQEFQEIQYTSLMQ